MESRNFCLWKKSLFRDLYKWQKWWSNPGLSPYLNGLSCQSDLESCARENTLQPPYCLLYTTTFPSVWERGVVTLVYINFWKIIVLPYLLPNTAKWSLQQVKHARRKWHSVVLYVMCWSNPLVPVWQLSSLEGFSIKLWNLIKSDKQISCISRGRIVINQARALQLAARPHMLTHWDSTWKMGWSEAVTELVSWKPVSQILLAHTKQQHSMPPCLLFC